MSKELEALERIKKFYPTWRLSNREAFNIVEKALKALEQLQVIIGAEKIEDLPKLALETENEWYSACHKLKEAEKKLKALEIIKEKGINISELKFSYSVNEYNICKGNENESLTQQEYDIMKEALS